MPQNCNSFPCGSLHVIFCFYPKCPINNISELINQVMYLLAFSLRLTVSCSRGFSFINALSKIFPLSASSISESFPLAGLYTSLADFIFNSFISTVGSCHTLS